MNSKKIIELIKLILENNEIITNKIRKNKAGYALKITNQSSVRRFFSLVKPSNPYYIERFLN